MTVPLTTIFVGVLAALAQRCQVVNRIRSQASGNKSFTTDIDFQLQVFYVVLTLTLKIFMEKYYAKTKNENLIYRSCHNN